MTPPDATRYRAGAGVVLMTYGSPRDLDDVGAYLERIRGGNAPTPDLVAEFQRRYAAIGGRSPLVETTRTLALRLEEALDVPVESGMRFSEPSIPNAVARLAERGATMVLGLVLSPQYSPLIMGGYQRALDAACAEHGLATHLVGDWHLDARFVEVLAVRVRRGLARFENPKSVPVLMTAHSLPKRVVDAEPGYVEALRETAEAVASAAGLSPDRWLFAYQSAGHTPEPWLKPDLLEVLPDLAKNRGAEAVLVAPVQFLADHLETLYDVDVAGAQEAREAGIKHYVRIPAPNADADFVEALAGVARRGLRAVAPEGAAREAVAAP